MNVFGVELGSVIDMQNVLSEFMVGREIVSADKTFRIKILLYPWITPIDWNGVHMEWIDQFLCAPTRATSVFKSDVEAVAGEPIHLHLVAVTSRQPVSGVVQGSAG